MADMQFLDFTVRRPARWGTITLVLATFQYPVVFPDAQGGPLPDASYRVGFFIEGVSVSLGVTSKTPNGFILGMSLSLSGALDWLAVDV